MNRRVLDGRLVHFARWKYYGRLLLLMILPYILASHATAQSTTADEYEIRAAMLFNLTKFIEWPSWKFDAAHPQFSICLVGADPVGADLDSLLQNKVVNSKPVVVRHLSSLDSVADCHILYIGSSARKNVSRASAELEKGAVLTVSEKSNADIPKQVVGLPTVDEHVRIEVNLSAAQRSGFTVSSKLLHLATVTH